MKYFAYGSNMSTKRLQARAPSSRPFAMARLDGYTLKFHKRSIDGSGKCNIVRTGDPEHHVFGVLFDIAESEKPSLDRAEGSGRGYTPVNIHVQSGSEQIAAFAYIAMRDWIDDTLLPYAEYLAFIVEGAREHRLPEPYIRTLLTHATMPGLKK